MMRTSNLRQDRDWNSLGTMMATQVGRDVPDTSPGETRGKKGAPPTQHALHCKAENRKARLETRT